MLTIILGIITLILLYVCWVNASDDNTLLMLLPAASGTWLLITLGLTFVPALLISGVVSFGIIVWGTIHHEHSSNSGSAPSRSYSRTSTRSRSSGTGIVSTSSSASSSSSSNTTPKTESVPFAQTLVVDNDAPARKERAFRRQCDIKYGYFIKRTIKDATGAVKAQAAKASSEGRRYLYFAHYSESLIIESRGHCTPEEYRYCGAEIKAGVESALAAMGFQNIEVHDDSYESTKIITRISCKW